MFEIGKHVDVVGTSIKGRGFQGMIKRHGFTGGKATHGVTTHRKQPGSIGASAYPSRVIKGKRLPGRMGGKQRDHEEPARWSPSTPSRTLLVVRGAIPGPVRTASCSSTSREEGGATVATAKTYSDPTASEKGTVELPDALFEQQVNEHLL